MPTYSPRASTTAVDSARYRFSGVIQSSLSSSSVVTVGSVPIETGVTPSPAAASRSARMRSSSPCSRRLRPASRTRETGMLISTLYAPISDWTLSSSSASMTSTLVSEGSPSASTRLNSSSSPIVPFDSKLAFCRYVSKVSRFSWSLRRYRVRSRGV